MTPRRVVVTGVGAVTPVGNDAASTWRALVAGMSGVAPVQLPGDSCPVRIAGTVKDFSLDAYPAAKRYRRYLSRGPSFGVAAMLQALADARVGDAYPPDRRAIALGASAAPVEVANVLEFSVAWHGSGPQQAAVQPPLDAIRHAQTTDRKSVV
jgi:3-oxoacyl-[acyl-carrier-protein] synthase II